MQPLTQTSYPVECVKEHAAVTHLSDALNDTGLAQDPDDGEGATQKWKWDRNTLAFFLMGLLVGLPAMPTTAAASKMFAGTTGVYGITLSLAAAVSSFVGPMIGPLLPNNAWVMILTIASALTYIICTLPEPLISSDGSGRDGQNRAGPVVGTALAGFVYSWGTQFFLGIGAFFPSESVVALSIGSGLSIILGSGVFIALMEKAFDQDWRKCFLVFMPSALGIPLVWWLLFETSRRRASEWTRKQSRRKAANSITISDTETREDPLFTNTRGSNRASKQGFGPHRSRTGMLFKILLPKYILPLIICTTCAILCLFGLAPTLQTLNRFRGAPLGDLEYQLLFFSYGSAQFIFSVMVAVLPVPTIWIWTSVEVTLTVISLVQLWHPFLTYFWAWFAIMFLIGGCVGGSVTNTNYKIAEDFRRNDEPDEVRSFANSYAGFGNFGGDALGGAIGLVIEVVIGRQLKPTL